MGKTQDYNPYVLSAKNMEDYLKRKETFNFSKLEESINGFSEDPLFFKIRFGPKDYFVYITTDEKISASIGKLIISQGLNVDLELKSVEASQESYLSRIYFFFNRTDGKTFGELLQEKFGKELHSIGLSLGKYIQKKIHFSSDDTLRYFITDILHNRDANMRKMKRNISNK
jgi:hypothetical protein